MTIPRPLAAIAAIAIWGFALAPSAAQPVNPEAPDHALASDSATTSSAAEAVALLRKIEEKNADLATLAGSFHQVRLNPMFLEEIHSEGQFWYQKPSLFRCDYDKPSETRFYLLEKEMLTYTPELNQVERIALKPGESAPINQMLVGFGVDTDAILKVFDVAILPANSASPGIISLQCQSRDLDRSMGYEQITVHFAQDDLTPKVIDLVEEQGTVTLTLKKVEKNAQIDPAKFRKDFPADVEVLDY